MKSSTDLLNLTINPGGNNLTASDFQNLLNLYEGRAAFWTSDALLRCKGLISLDGFNLQPEGIKKVERLLEGVEQLKIGVPIERRTADRSQEAIWGSEWYRGKIKNAVFDFNRHMIWTTSKSMKRANSCHSTTEQAQYMRRIMMRHWKGLEKYLKVSPYAVQVDSIEIGTIEFNPNITI
jgi:hypothetical protein